MSQEVLAVVAGEEITQAELDLFVQSLPKEQQAYLADPEFKKYCLEQLTALYLFAKQGEEQKLQETEEYNKIIANAKRDILAQMAMREVLKGAAVSEEEVKEYYDANPANYARSATVNAKHILVDTEEKCNEALECIKNGEKSFEEAAQAFSKCPSGSRGRDLGEFGKGQMVKEFEDAAFNAEIGEIVGPVATQFGFHLIRVEKKTEASTAPFAEVEESIRMMILQQRQHQVYNEAIAALKEKYMEQ